MSNPSNRNSVASVFESQLAASNHSSSRHVSRENLTSVLDGSTAPSSRNSVSLGSQLRLSVGDGSKLDEDAAKKRNSAKNLEGMYAKVLLLSAVCSDPLMWLFICQLIPSTGHEKEQTFQRAIAQHLTHSLPKIVQRRRRVQRVRRLPSRHWRRTQFGPRSRCASIHRVESQQVHDFAAIAQRIRDYWQAKKSRRLRRWQSRPRVRDDSSRQESCCKHESIVFVVVIDRRYSKLSTGLGIEAFGVYMGMLSTKTYSYMHFSGFLYIG